jgi:hypothetical protein
VASCGWRGKVTAHPRPESVTATGLLVEREPRRTRPNPYAQAVDNFSTSLAESTG